MCSALWRCGCREYYYANTTHLSMDRVNECVNPRESRLHPRHFIITFCCRHLLRKMCSLLFHQQWLVCVESFR